MNLPACKNTLHYSVQLQVLKCALETTILKSKKLKYMLLKERAPTYIFRYKLKEPPSDNVCL